ncbi:RecQ family ATP-dependent DNA helicase [Desulfonatronospira sp. MSAO_Bac3]|uniref:RecQ family ATP-dependent DNA helicase n=1 Tax=Desulfonatronospira sp. MSAO_Bac3 TaxID=2293857 RepID=UPI000FF25DFB|nr:RecQ family ATP-dependent DNA helicase [Desulfonatronospira sp. MSAO_Bac3]RQD78499.1 MAG: RecQ family ATP-dependent DNA helicase [Desulfonatronospira sp. MSAO_Bac3]
MTTLTREKIIDLTLSREFQNIVVLDLEIHPERKTLIKIGATGPGWQPRLAFQGNFRADEALSRLEQSFGRASFMLGHNIIGHDLPWLRKHFPEFSLLKLPALDTLHLSPLAFPKNPYHHLVKDYKLVRTAKNDPIQDCAQAELVFQDEIQAFQALPREQLIFYGTLMHRSHPESGLGHFFAVLAGADLKDKEWCKSFWEENAGGHACVSHAQSAFETLWDDSRESCSLAYILAWLQVSGSNSVLPTWVWKRHAAIPGILRSLRETPCSDPACSYCSSAFDSRAQLQRYFGYPDYLPVKDEDPPLQRLVVETLIRGNDCLAVLPTGAGKSLCYQLPALMKAEQGKRLSIIVSPLQSLMKDQVDGLLRKGILQGCTINSTLTLLERSQALEGIRMGDLDLVWISPEQLRNTTVKDALRSREIAMVIMDEAHCFSKWGHDFRPDYLALASFLDEICPGPPHPEPQIACFTATAKKDVVDEILDYFRNEMGRDLVLFQGGHERSNLRFDVIPCAEPEKTQRMHSILQSVLVDKEDGGGIVFASTRRKTKEYAEALEHMGWNVEYYHAGRTPEERTSVQERFLAGEIQVIVATNAFGMGVDKPDVRVVIHASAPGSLENYLQEAGRAGRDHRPAVCCLLFDPDDLDTQFELCRASEISARDIRSMYGGLKSLASSRNNPDMVMTSGELLASEEFEEYGFDTLDSHEPMADTKVRTALSWLERRGKIRRGDNKTTAIQGRLLVKDKEEALKIMGGLNLSPSEHALWMALLDIIMQADPKELLNTDMLSARLGAEPDRILRSLGAMRQARILNHDLNMTAYLRKGIQDDSRSRLREYLGLEESLFALMEEDEPDARAGVVYNMPLRPVCQRLKERGHTEAAPAKLLHILKLLVDEKLLRLHQLSQNSYQVILQHEWDRIRQHASRRNQSARVLLVFLLDRIDTGVSGKDLLVSFRTGEAENALRANMITAHLSDHPSLCRQGLSALHHCRAVCLQNGLSIIRPAMSISVTDPKGRFSPGDYLSLSLFYRQKIAQVHIMGRFAELGAVFDGISQALRFVRDYFQKSRTAFVAEHLQDRRDILELPVTREQHAAILEKLSSVQRGIVEAPAEKNMLVVAGPGSGKTRVIVHRMAYLIKVLKVRPYRILAVAFNRSAVAEMRRRLKDLLGKSGAGVKIHTYHSMAMSITGHSLAGKGGDTSVFQGILQEAVDYLDGTSTQEDGSALHWRDRLLGIQHILVDEYQDINDLEYQLISLLAGRNEDEQSPRPSMLAVGDADQNIYSFQGANVRFIQRFAQEYQAEIVHMVHNYRSLPPVTLAANALIRHNQDRMNTPPVEAVRKDKAEPVGMIMAGSREAMLKAALDQARRLMVQDGLSPEDICILCRTNQEVFALANLARHAGMELSLMRRRNISLPLVREVHEIMDLLMRCPGSLCTGSEVYDLVMHLMVESSARSRLWLYHLEIMARDYRDECGSMRRPVYEFCEHVWDSSRDLRRMESRSPGALRAGTMHGAKGLEFPAVILAGTPGDRESPEEERRLYYVGMTRARDRLVLCCGPDHPFAPEILAAGPEAVSRISCDIALTPVEQNLAREELWEMSPEHVILSYPAWDNIHGETTAAIDALQDNPGKEFTFLPWANRYLVCTAGVPVTALSDRGSRIYENYLSRGFRVKQVIFLAALHRKASQEDQTLKELRCSSWYVPLFQVVWSRCQD